jgi:dipeptidyl aminopeptidase/acylaminoacyl peptidase
MRRLLVTVALALAVMLAIGVAASGAATAPGRWIVFSATSNGSLVNQLFRIQSSGGGLKQLTTGTLSSIAPVFSPDGKRIAFARSGVGILTLNLDGTGLHRLTTNPRDTTPAWSPDGKSIAFVRAGKNGWDLYTMSSSGGGARRLSQAPSAGRPSWTASGLLIPSGGDLLKVDTRTGHIQKYYGAEIDAVWGMNTASVSPNAKALAFVGARNPDPGDLDCGDGPCQRFALYTEDISKKAKKPHLLVKDAGPATFSADGKQLAFVFRGGITLRSVANGASKLISTGTATPTVAAPPTWQPR